MAFPPRDPGDFGIVFYKIGTASPGVNYTDIRDATIAVEELTTSYTGMATSVFSAVIRASGRGALSLFVYYTANVSTSIDVKLQGRYKTTTAPFNTNWADLTSTLQSTGVAGQGHNLAPSANPYIIETAGGLSIPEVRVVVKANGGVDEDDIVVIAARCN